MLLKPEDRNIVRIGFCKMCLVDVENRLWREAKELSPCGKLTVVQGTKEVKWIVRALFGGLHEAGRW